MKPIVFLLEKIFITFIFSTLFISCRVEPAEMDVKKVITEIGDRKIKRLTDAQISQAAYDRGTQILTSLQNKHQNQFLKCGFDDTSILNDTLKQMISRLEVLCAPQTNFSQKEKELWEAFVYNIDNQISFSDQVQNIQKIDDQHLLYTYPFVKEENNKKKLMVLWVMLDKKEIIRGINMKKLK